MKTIERKLIARYLSKQQALDADPKAIQQIGVIENIYQARNTSIFSMKNSNEEIEQGLNEAYHNWKIFFHHHDVKRISFYDFCNNHENTKKTHVNSIYVVGIMFVR